MNGNRIDWLREFGPRKSKNYIQIYDHYTATPHTTTNGIAVEFSKNSLLIAGKSRD